MSRREMGEAQRAAARLHSVLDNATSFSDDLAEIYQHSFAALNSAMRSAAVAQLPRPNPSLDAIRENIHERMRECFAGDVEERFLRMRKYGQAHKDIYALLWQSMSVYVASWRIRIITAQAVETERRIRELGDLGLDIMVSKDENLSYYRLNSAVPNLDFAAAFLLRDKARKARGLSPEERRRVIRLAESHYSLP